MRLDRRRTMLGDISGFIGIIARAPCAAITSVLAVVACLRVR